MIERRTPNRLLRFAASLAIVGCASPAVIAFDSRFPDNDPNRTAAMVDLLPPPSPLGSPDNTLGKPLVAALTHGDPPELIVHDLGSGELLWRREMRAGRRPQLLGDLLLTSVGRELRAFGLATGEPVWQSPILGEVYLGAARWEQVLVHVCGDAAFGPGRRRSRVTGLDARTGRQLWQHEVAGRIGKPETAGAMVFVPWDLQYLTVLDARTGREMARLRSTDDVISWVKTGRRGVFFGHDSLYRLGERGYAGSKTGVPRLVPPLPKVPWLSSLRASAYTFKPAKRSAEGRIGLFFEPVSDRNGGLGVSDDRYYLFFFRYIFAFDAKGTLVWSRRLDAETIAVQPVGGGLLAVMESGRVELLAAVDGRSLDRQSLPEPLASAELDAEGITTDPGVLQAGSEPVGEGPRNELIRIALDPDNRLLAARIFAVEQLAKSADPGVTRDLLDLYEQDPLPEPLKESIAAALAVRPSGEGYLLGALGRHHDFLRGTRAPRLEVLVPALVRADEKRAVPLLVTHLFEPETPMQVLPDLVSAIDVLGDEMVAGPLLDFISRYRADSAFAGSPEALERAARAVLRRDGWQYRERLRLIAIRFDTHPELARGIEQALQEKTEDRTAVVSPSPAERETVPDRIDQLAIDAVFARHVDTIRACITEELARNPELSRVRIAFVLEREGRARDLRFSPASPGLVECLAPRIKGYRFPRIRAARQLASYTVTLRPRAETDVETGPTIPSLSSAEPERWWARSILREVNRDEVAPDPRRRPWWFSALPVTGDPDPSGEVRSGKASEASPRSGQAEAGEIGGPDLAPPPTKTTERDWWLPTAP